MEMNTQANAVPAKHAPGYGDNFKHLFEGVHFRFPKFQHTHPAVINVNEVADERMTTGQRIADRVATGMGSWRFIIIQSVIVVVWIISNVRLLSHPFDPYQRRFRTSPRPLACSHSSSRMAFLPVTRMV